MDLLPKGAPKDDVRQWLEATALHKRLSPIATFLVSSRTGECYIMHSQYCSRGC